VGSVAVRRSTLPFSSTYLCENVFSTLVDIKAKSRKKHDCEADLRCCYRYLHRLELLRQAQEKDGNSGHKLTGKQPATTEITRRDDSPS